MTIDDFLRIIWDKRILIVILPVFAMIAAAFISFNVLSPTYLAETSLYVLNSQSVDQGAISYDDLITSEMLMADYRELALSRRVVQKVAKDLGLVSLEDYDIQINSANDTRIINISVEGQDALMAAQIANTMAAEFSKSVVELMGAENVNVIDEADVPLVPSGPARERNIILAGVIGLMLAICIVLAKEFLNTTIRTTDDVQAQLGIPVLAQIGRMKELRKS